MHSLDLILVRLRLAAVCLLCAIAFGCSSASHNAPAPTSAASTSAGQNNPTLTTLLARANYYRAAAGLPPIEASPSLSQACQKHSAYLVNNHIGASSATISDGKLSDLAMQTGTSEESVGNPFYSEEGAAAARYSYVIRGATLPPDATDIVDQLAALGFTELLFTNPQLDAAGWGQYCYEGGCVGTFSLKFGLPKEKYRQLYDSEQAALFNPALGQMPFLRGHLKRAVEMPPSGVILPVTSFGGQSHPSPITSCAGYAAPTGVPIMLVVGAPVSGDGPVKLSKQAFAEDGTELEACGFDSTTYANPDGSEQREARNVLYEEGAIMLIPKAPLKPGHNYTVSITADGQDYNWSFRVASDAR